ncbi:MAG: hypothetical protein HQK60_06605, partial [Deltaproteobacteria bacterium]|nr:hypothetical protein [Deltaproteobacteria bacterium]
VQPNEWVYLVGSPKSIQPKEVTISAEEGVSFKIESDTSTIPDKITYKIDTVKPNHEYKLSVSPKTDQIGRYTGYVDLKTDNPKKKDIRVRVTLDIKGEIEYFPAIINYGLLDLKLMAGKKNELKRTIFISKTTGDGLKISGFEIDKNLFEASLKEVEKEKKYSLELLTKIENLKPGETKKDIIITTNSASMPKITIPVVINAK